MNLPIFYFFYYLGHSSSLASLLTIFFAQFFPYLVGIAAIVFIWRHQTDLSNPLTRAILRFKELTFVLCSSLLAYIVSTILKSLIHLDRPFVVFRDVVPLISESGHTFPSGHATFLSALAIAIYFINKKAGYWFIACAVVIGIARVMAGVHYPIDILAGYILGSLTTYLVYRFFLKSPVYR